MFDLYLLNTHLVLFVVLRVENVLCKYPKVLSSVLLKIKQNCKEL